MPPEPFGHLLKRLRKAGTLSQQALASAATISMQTIRRAEQSASPTSDWHRSTASSIFRVLSNAARISDADRAAYFKATRLEAVHELGEKMLAGVRQETAEAKTAIAESSFAYSTRGDIDATTAHSWLSRMLEEAGPVRVLSALEGIAAAWGLDLPPRITRDEPRSKSFWVHSTGVIDMGEGLRGEILTPVPLPPAKPASSKPHPKRNSA